MRTAIDEGTSITLVPKVSFAKADRSAVPVVNDTSATKAVTFWVPVPWVTVRIVACPEPPE